MRRRFRLWMTGSVAVVMAALMPSRAAAEAERNETHRLLRTHQASMLDVAAVSLQTDPR